MTAQEHNIAVPHNIELMVDFYTRYRVPEEQWGGTIAVFVGDRWWCDADAILEKLEPAVVQLAAETRPARPPVAGHAHRKLLCLFESFGPFTVAMAGLADGVNPCALAALVFLISYLTLAKRSSKQILATGMLFGAGVFGAYLAVGLGVFRGLQSLGGFSSASKLLYPVMAVATLVLTGLTLRDYLTARAGPPRQMTLRLPKPLVRLSHGTVRRLLGGRGFLALAFATGITVSILELFCTGQIYLPTLMYVSSTEQLQTRAIGLLVLYVAMFTLPIIGVALAAYCGVTSQKLTSWARRHTAGTKLILTVVFLVLTIYPAAFSLHLF